VTRRWRRRLLRGFARAQRPAAWFLLAAGVVSFVSVAVGLVVVGEARLATLLVAADLVVSGFDAAQEAEDDEGEER
jgi:hypothetical protein